MDTVTKSLSLSLQNGVYRICPYTRTTLGASRADLFVEFISQDISVEKMGKTILQVLNRPQKIIPHPSTPSEWKEYTKEWYKVMKIKSWKSFAKNAKDLSLTLQGNQVKITPTKNNQPKGYFSYLSEKARFCSVDDPKALGQAIIDAFADCE